MTEEQIREIMREELSYLLKRDRYTFNKLIQILDGQNIQVGASNGTQIATATTQKLGFFGKTPIVQPSSTGQTTGFTAGAGSAVDSAATFTGGVGSTAYTIGDIVRHLKNLGHIAS